MLKLGVNKTWNKLDFNRNFYKAKLFSIIKIYF